jgi:hypothetical protein
VQVKGYNVPYGLQPFALVMDNATWPAPALSVSASVPNVQLTWTTRGQDNAYQLWRSTSPYFAPGDPGSTKLAETPGSTYNDAVLGGPAESYFYVVRAVVNPGQNSSASNRAGVFEFELMPGE